ncbi:MAG: thioredoxin [Lachnospiraceae bacterium]|nr:thioredoxin [Lachnospiraceae bacterium]
MAALHLNEANFEEEVLKSDKPVIVDFWASWCGPCKMLGPIVEQISDERDDVKVCKVDVDANGSLAEKYSVMSIPCVFLFKDGEVAGKSVGALPKDQLLKALGL